MRLVVRWLMVLAAAAGVGRAQGTSTWQGTMMVGADARRMVVETTAGGVVMPVATDVYLQYFPSFPSAVKVDGSAWEGDRLRFSIAGGKGVFEGKMVGDSIVGTWVYGGTTSAVTLKKVGADAAWKVPFQYQYHLKDLTKDITYARPSPEEARIAFSPRLAVDYMERGAVAWTSERGCVACHTNGTYMVARPMLTAELGPPQAEIREFFVGRLKQQLAAEAAGDTAAMEPTQAVYLAAGLAIWDAQVTHRLSKETAEALGLMFRLQRATGDWVIEDDNNLPLESSPYQLATVAARAVGNAPGWLAAQKGTAVAAKVELLVRYLRAEKKLQADYDRTDLLWAAAEFPGLMDEAEKQRLVAMIFAHQRPDGGWAMRSFAQPEEWGKGNRAAKLRAEPEFADVAGPASDGHMTGLAIIALRKAGVAATDARVQRGVAWLLKNQRESGRWWTRSLNRDGWQFISYSGTVYPLVALGMCHALPAQNGLAQGH